MALVGFSRNDHEFTWVGTLKARRDEPGGLGLRTGRQHGSSTATEPLSASASRAGFPLIASLRSQVGTDGRLVPVLVTKLHPDHG